MRQKALALLSRFSYIGRHVKIERGDRGVRGQVGTLRDLFWHKEEPWGVIQFPSGMRTAVPLSVTDVPTKAFPDRKASPQIDVPRLLDVAKYCQRVRPRTKRKRRRNPQIVQ